MTIISEDKLTVKDPDRVSFTPLRREVHDAIAADRHLRCADEEKKRLIKSSVNYGEFKALVSTVGMVPVKRGIQTRAPQSIDRDMMIG